MSQKSVVTVFRRSSVVGPGPGCSEDADRFRERRRSDFVQGWVDRRVLSQDPLFEQLHGGAWFDAQVFDPSRTRRLVDLARLRLPATSVQGEHQQLAWPLPKPLRVHERLELADELRVPAELEIGGYALLEGGEAQVLEPGDRALRERLVRELDERGPAPEHKRFVQEPGGLPRSAGSERFAPALKERLEGGRV